MSLNLRTSDDAKDDYYIRNINELKEYIKEKTDYMNIDAEVITETKITIHTPISHHASRTVTMIVPYPIHKDDQELSHCLFKIKNITNFIQEYDLNSGSSASSEGSEESSSSEESDDLS